MTTTTFVAPPGKRLQAGLWTAQAVVAVIFCGTGIVKLTTPIARLSQSIPWTGQLPEAFVRTMGMIDIAGGLGIVLPFVTRIKPRIGVLAALCCAVLQICAIVFHVSRHEIQILPANVVLLPLCLFVFWGRRKQTARRDVSAPR